MFAELGSRMKSREDKSQYPQSAWLILRVDGRSFSTKTREFAQFDPIIRHGMIAGCEALIKDMGKPMILCFTNSDEASFLMCADVGKLTEHWFGGKPQKIVSVAASAFTLAFNQEVSPSNFVFDARVHSIPPQDAANYFVWRSRDTQRNAMNIKCRELYGTEAVPANIKEQTEQYIPPAFLHGTVMRRALREEVINKPTYWQFGDIIEEERNAR